MSKTERLSITQPKYHPSSILVGLSYLSSLLSEEASLQTLKYLKYAPLLVHTYHLFSIINDRYTFDAKAQKIDDFMNKSVTSKNVSYTLQNVDCSYGFGVTDLQTVFGLMYNVTRFMCETGNPIQKLTQKLCNTMDTGNLKNWSEKLFIVTLTLTGISFLTNTGTANIEFIYTAKDQIVEHQPIGVENHEYDIPLSTCASMEIENFS